MAPDPLRIEGTLRSWDDDRGFGFLESPQAADTFAHISAFTGRPQQGQRFSYVIGFASDGRTQAEEVREVRGTPPPAARPRPAVPSASAVGLLAIPALALLVLVLMLRWQLPALISFIYAVASLLTFIVYGADKLAARRGWRRVSEATLLSLGFLCGWPGGLLAQQLLRHKTRKEDFQRQFWQTVLLNCVIVAGVAAAVHYDLLARLSI